MKKAVLPLSLSALLFTAYHLSSSKKVEADAIPPNIIFFLIDDLGMISTPPYTNGTANGMVWNKTENSLDTTGIAYSTPNIYNFSNDAMVLTNMYATPSCAPSRAQLMSGNYPFQTDITWPGWTSNNLYLKDSTYVQLLNKDSGPNYNTAFGGKWNLRYGITDFTALNVDDNQGLEDDLDVTNYSELVYNQMLHLQSCGFDTTFGPSHYSEAEGLYTGGAALIGNTVDYYPEGIDSIFFPDTLHTWAKDFVKQGIENRKTTKQPFYLHYALGLIHDEFHTANEAFYPDTNRTRKGINLGQNWADKLEYADSLIGDILNNLINSDSSVYNNTVIIIAGDNGTESGAVNDGYYSQYQGNQILGGKITYNTWGSRVPFIIRWPNQIAEGTYDGLADFSDVFNTIVEGIVQTDNSFKTQGTSFYDQIKIIGGDLNSGTRRAVYSQMQSGAFVANEGYQYRVNTSNQSSGASTSGFYSVSEKPLSNIILYDNNSLSNYIKEDSLNSSSFEWQTFDTLYSYLCYLKPSDYTYDPLNICDSTAINTLVTDYWATAED